MAHLPHLAFSPVPATLTPLQAVSAAQLLHARQLVPIHYGLHLPGNYEEYPAAPAETSRLAAELGVPLTFSGKRAAAGLALAWFLLTVNQSFIDAK